MLILQGLLLGSLLVSCSSPNRPVGFSGGFDSVDLAPTAATAAPTANLSVLDGNRDDSRLSSDLLGISLAAIDAGILSGNLGPAPPIAYNEVRMGVARERSDDTREEVLGLGAELSLALNPQLFARLGFWILEDDDSSSVDGAKIGRLTFGLGHIVRLSETTHLVGSLGFEWERDRKGSVNFFSLAHSGDEGLFGSDESEFGFDADITLRHRLTKWLEIDAGVRGETLRKDSVGAFGSLRFFLSPNVALYFEYEDVDEPTASAGLALIGG